ncbi:hypothetical protein AB0J01_27655 [Streptomyces sp. NPDC050204]|uniref:hypothetical protein n=1 Tax=Streptomyces sp. NPDC050204 TaxID=3155514 RepID=UPI00342B191F
MTSNERLHHLQRSGRTRPLRQAARMPRLGRAYVNCYLRAKDRRRGLHCGHRSGLLRHLGRGRGPRPAGVLATRTVMVSTEMPEKVTRELGEAVLGFWPKLHLTVEQIAERLEMTDTAVSRAWERAIAKAREEGRKVPWRRVYEPRRDLLQEAAANAA